MADHVRHASGPSIHDGSGGSMTVELVVLTPVIVVFLLVALGVRKVCIGEGRVGRRCAGGGGCGGNRRFGTAGTTGGHCSGHAGAPVRSLV